MSDVHPATEELVDYLHGELSAARDAAVHAHLAECSSCAQTRDAEASLTELLRAHALAEERELPPGVVAGIRRAIEQPVKPVRQSWSPMLTRAFALSAAAAVAAIVYFGSNARHGSANPTTIDAAYYLENHTALNATAPFSQDPPMPVTLTSENATDERTIP